MVTQFLGKKNKLNYDCSLRSLIGSANLLESQRILYKLLYRNARGKLKPGTVCTIRHGDKKIRIFIDFAIYYFPADQKAFLVDKSELLGRGNFGKTYQASYSLAVDHKKDCVRVDKVNMVLKSQKSSRLSFSDQEKSELHRESAITRLAHGSNVSSVMFRTTRKTKAEKAYFVMQKYKGVTLQAILARRHELNLNITERLLLSYKIMKQVSEIHEKGIRHRDLNPSNCLIDLDKNTAVVLDFGLSATQDSPLEKAIPKYLPYPLKSKKKFEMMDDVYAIGLSLKVLFQLNKSEIENLKKCDLGYLKMCKQVQVMIEAMTSLDVNRRPTSSEITCILYDMYNLLAEKELRRLKGALEKIDSNKSVDLINRINIELAEKKFIDRNHSIMHLQKEGKLLISESQAKNSHSFFSGLRNFHVLIIFRFSDFCRKIKEKLGYTNPKPFSPT